MDPPHNGRPLCLLKMDTWNVNSAETKDLILYKNDLLILLLQVVAFMISLYGDDKMENGFGIDAFLLKIMTNVFHLAMHPFHQQF